MTKVDEPMPQVALETIKKHTKPNTPQTPDRPSGKAWLRQRLERGEYGMCGDHYHLECTQCGSTKCGGQSGYSPYETIDHHCECGNGEPIEHIVVPYDTFGQFVGFPD